MPPLLRPIADGVIRIDLQFQGRPQVIAAYLLYDGREAALVETGPTSTMEKLLEGVQAAGVPLEALRHLIVTHIHLDHAGASGALIQRLPWARVYVHPVGAPHLVDPSRLLASAARIYGDLLKPLWGEVIPVPADRLVVVSDGERLSVAGHTLIAFDTPGHARHHHAFLDETTGLLFTGDIAGVRLPGIRYVRPPTPPPELDLEAWSNSIARLRALKASGLCLTHFDVHRGDIEWHWEDLERRLWEWGRWIREMMAGNFEEAEMVKRLRERADEELRAAGADPEFYDVAASYESVVAGYLRYWRKRAEAMASGMRG
ncbi:MBL fold metallo-hydrolase [Thermoflexus sp.]|uniref:MBL fold metallo-hydrolase n=1 Tax=Thermoflexus sp. TaxID=1969742 RepID=UPI001807E3E8|nr:MBL fold metallo-hydrolase [Thermoflexus sp.]